MISAVASQREGCGFDPRSWGLCVRARCPCVCVGGTPSSSHGPNMLERRIGNSKFSKWVSASGCLSFCVAAWWTGQPAGIGVTNPLGPEWRGEVVRWMENGWMDVCHWPVGKSILAVFHCSILELIAIWVIHNAHICHLGVCVWRHQRVLKTQPIRFVSKQATST